MDKLYKNIRELMLSGAIFDGQRVEREMEQLVGEYVTEQVDIWKGHLEARLHQQASDLLDKAVDQGIQNYVDAIKADNTNGSFWERLQNGIMAHFFSQRWVRDVLKSNIILSFEKELDRLKL